jgi:hypothetical protein
MSRRRTIIKAEIWRVTSGAHGQNTTGRQTNTLIKRELDE